MATSSNALKYAKKLLGILHRDKPRLDLIRAYWDGHQTDPYMPDTAGDEYKMLAYRSTTNWMKILTETPCQMLYVDGVRPGRDLPAGGRLADLPEWNHWQLSGLDAKQVAVHRDALRFGHSFTVTELRRGKVQTKGLSPRRTAAIYSDPANDETPVAALTITAYPTSDGDKDIKGTAILWDDTQRYDVTFKELGNPEGVSIKGNPTKHGASACPVTRFAAMVDLDGRTMGVVEPMIVLQDRINQTIFDLLVVQTFGAFKVRTVAGLAPPYLMQRVKDPDTGTWEMVPKLDDAGRPMMDDVQLSAMRILFAKDPETRFGTLDETPLDGYLAAIESAFKTFSALAQLPPHYVLGVIPNLAAEAMQAAETTLERKVASFKQMFGQSWERVFRLAAELNGIPEAVDDYRTEAVWRDMEARALAKQADAIGKLAAAGIPPKLLIRLLSGLTTEELDEWTEAIEEADATGQLAASIDRARTNTSARTVSRTPAVDRVP